MRRCHIENPYVFPKLIQDGKIIPVITKAVWQSDQDYERLFS